MSPLIAGMIRDHHLNNWMLCTIAGMISDHHLNNRMQNMIAEKIANQQLYNWMLYYMAQGLNLLVSIPCLMMFFIPALLVFNLKCVFNIWLRICTCWFQNFFKYYIHSNQLYSSAISTSLLVACSVCVPTVLCLYISMLPSLGLVRAYWGALDPGDNRHQSKPNAGSKCCNWVFVHLVLWFQFYPECQVNKNPVWKKHAYVTIA